LQRYTREMKYQPTKGVDYDRETYQVKGPIAVKVLQWAEFKYKKFGGKTLACLHNYLCFL